MLLKIVYLVNTHFTYIINRINILNSLLFIFMIYVMQIINLNNETIQLGCFTINNSNNCIVI